MHGAFWRFLALLRKAPLPIPMGRLDLRPAHKKMGAPAVSGGNLISLMLIVWQVLAKSPSPLAARCDPERIP
jgi:hypothetical protein